MHGQRREEYKSRLLDPIVSKGLAQKAHQWTTLTRTLLERRIRTIHNHAANPNAKEDELEETLQLTTKALTVNPDPHHLWNLRRELLVRRRYPSNHTAVLEEPSLSSSRFRMEDELKLTAACLERNPKAYGAWFHRKWSVRQHLQQTATNKASNEKGLVLWLDTELALCAQLLLLDERNFHCWNYRRFVVAAKALTIRSSHHDNDTSSSLSNNNAVLFASSLDGSWNEWISSISTTNGNEEDAMHHGDAHHQSSPPIICMGLQISPNLKDNASNATTTTTTTTPSNTKSHKNHQISRTTTTTTTIMTQFKELVWAEWDFTKTKIEANFSNCSAFHYRSKLLPWVLMHSPSTSDHPSENKLALAQQELELVQNAIFTEPDDQTAWWYHRFLLQWAQPTNDSHNDDSENDENDNIRRMFCQLLEQEAETLRDLIETEENQCKWGFLALHAVLVLLQTHTTNIVASSAQKDHQTESNQCLDHLIELDPDRAMRYHGMKS